MRRLDHEQMAEFVRAVHRDDDGHITVAARTVYGSFRQKHCHGIDELLDTVADTYSTKTDIYISINSFYLPLRRAEALRRINAICCDIDISKRYYGDPEILLEQLRMQFYEDRSFPAPSIMIDSGAGCHFYWLLEDLPHAALPFWQAVAGHMANEIRKRLADQEHLKIDVGVSTDSQRVMRLPGTYNQGSGRMCRMLVCNALETYRLDELRDKFGFGRQLRTKRFFPKDGNPYYARLLSDLTMLCTLRQQTDEDTWCRRRMTFMFRHFALLAGYDTEKALQLTKEYNAEFTHPMPDQKLQRHTESAEKAFKQGRAYRYKVSTLVEVLGITRAEMTHMDLLVDDLTRLERKRARRRARYTNRGVDGLTDKEREMAAARDVIAALVAGGKTQSEIAKLTGYSMSKIKRLRSELAKAGALKKQTRPVASRRTGGANAAIASGSNSRSLYVCDFTPRWFSGPNPAFLEQITLVDLFERGVVGTRGGRLTLSG